MNTLYSHFIPLSSFCQFLLNNLVRIPTQNHPNHQTGVVVFSNLILGIKGYMNVVIVVFGDAAAVWHEVPGVGWSVDAVEWGVEALLPDDI